MENKLEVQRAKKASASTQGSEDKGQNSEDETDSDVGF
jgi:hypothetical protein